PPGPRGSRRAFPAGNERRAELVGFFRPKMSAGGAPSEKPDESRAAVRLRPEIPTEWQARSDILSEIPIPSSAPVRFGRKNRQNAGRLRHFVARIRRRVSGGARSAGKSRRDVTGSRFRPGKSGGASPHRARGRVDPSVSHAFGRGGSPRRVY